MSISAKIPPLHYWAVLLGLGAAALLPAPARAQAAVPRELYGNVLNFDGSPLAGATVALSTDSRMLVITNAEGRFVLTTSLPAPSLRITSVGYYDTLVVVPAATAALSARLRPVPNYARQFKRQSKAAKRAYKK